MAGSAATRRRTSIAWAPRRTRSGSSPEAGDLDWEQGRTPVVVAPSWSGCPRACTASTPSARKQLSAHADPPDCFGKASRRRSWTLPASTVCLWPYDEMYNAEGVRNGEGFDYDERLERAREYWSRHRARPEPDRLLRELFQPVQRGGRQTIRHRRDLPGESRRRDHVL